MLVQGAAGNVGAYAVQLARAAGAHVFGGTLDVAIDTVGGKAQRDLFVFVREGGTLISSVSVPDAQLAQQCGIEAKFILVDVNAVDLKAVADLLDAQQLVVRIGQVLPLADARQAHEMLERLRPLPPGKVLLNALGDS